jgi:two-component system phosphate regulon sensor histidine kinase PhoR
MQFLWRPLIILTLAIGLGLWFNAVLIFTSLALGLMVVLQLHGLDQFNEWIRKGNFKLLPPITEPYGSMAREVQLAYRSQRQRINELARIARYFESLMSSLPEGVLILDEDGHVEYVNVAAREFLGLRADDVGRRLSGLVRHGPLMDFLNQPAPPEFVLIRAPKQPNTYLRVKLVDFKDQQRLIIFDDITQQQNMAQMRRDFISNASHELRTPLTVLVGYLEMLGEQVAQEHPDWVAPFEQMQVNAHRMQQILDDLMQLSKIENERSNDDFEVFDFSQMVQMGVQMVHDYSGGQHQIRSQVRPGIKVFGRASEMYSAVTNLLTNAVRYTPEGGAIDVRLDRMINGKARLSVKDTGIGIQSEHLGRLTERFYRVDTARSRASGGTGLGLAIVKHALENHGSHLQIRSEYGQGSEFYFDLADLTESSVRA